MVVGGVEHSNLGSSGKQVTTKCDLTLLFRLTDFWAILCSKCAIFTEFLCKSVKRGKYFGGVDKKSNYCDLIFDKLQSYPLYYEEIVIAIDFQRVNLVIFR